ncbi:MAG: GNAT family N-acetyltransferase [Lewinellaceae bacterium]|nr:GNAT family N-acetyltransferase [Lewinellaceae bacterium]
MTESFYLSTPRLLLLPLNYEQLIKYAINDERLEQELGLHFSPREISEDLVDALERTILPNVADPEKNYLFSTLWTLIDKAEQRMVGDLCFVGEPDLMGEIEIGYGIHEPYRNKGYMSEALTGIIKWANEQPLVQSIFAATEKDNLASANVLRKNNFIQFGETDTLYNWRLPLNK